MEQENKTLEYKETMTKTYLKTVSAYANYNDGVIIFGVDDDLNIKGISDPKELCLNIENQINDSIKPQVDYTLQINDDNTVTLKVFKGEYTPYLYNGKAYKRNNTSTIEVDSLELTRLRLSGLNLTYEELNSKEQDLHFDVLKQYLMPALHLETFNLDTLKNLNLYKCKHGYNNAAYLIADKNNAAGLDIVVFGENINEFKKRYTLSGESIIKQFYDAIDIFKDNYIIEVIDYAERKQKEKIPLKAFREALANAIIHRTYDVSANTKIEMHNDKIIISSPGGLSEGISEDQFLNGSFSLLRNPIIGGVFARLGIVEIFATGIKRINEAYKPYLNKPSFNITDNAITITLPIIKSVELTNNEKIIYEVMELNHLYKRNEIENASHLNKASVIRGLNLLEEKQIIKKMGSGPKVTYVRIK